MRDAQSVLYALELSHIEKVELVSKELNHLAAILHVYVLNFMKQKKMLLFF